MLGPKGQRTISGLYFFLESVGKPDFALSVILSEAKDLGEKL